MNRNLLKNILTEELLGTKSCESMEDYEIVEYMFEALMLEKFLFGEPISVPELRKLLRKKIVNFEFIKLDGEVRPARGTTMMKYIPKEDQPKGIRPSSDAVATFFDMDKEAWRSVSKKSKEIVLKKDKEKDRPIVVVQDKNKDKNIKKKGVEADKLGPEPEDELRVGDVRNYLNRNNKNILIRITSIRDDGVYAETFKEKTPFLIPPGRMRNIGEIASSKEKEEALKPRSIIKRLPTNINPKSQINKEKEPSELKPVTPETPEGAEGKIIEPIPIEDTETKEPPKEVDDREDAEELIQ